MKLMNGQSFWRPTGKETAHHSGLGGVRIPGSLPVIHPVTATVFVASFAAVQRPPRGADKADVCQHGRELQPHVRQHLQRLPTQHVLAREGSCRLSAALCAHMVG